jgi:hypothetical protein
MRLRNSAPDTSRWFGIIRFFAPKRSKNISPSLTTKIPLGPGVFLSLRKRNPAENMPPR